MNLSTLQKLLFVLPALALAGCDTSGQQAPKASAPVASAPQPAYGTTSTAAPASAASTAAPATTTAGTANGAAAAPTATAAADVQPAPRPTLSSGNTAAVGQLVTLPSGLEFQVLREGTGPVAKPGELVTVNYTGWLASTNTKFDSSIDRGQPFQFTLGVGGVIPGWDQGVAGMKVGEKRKLYIPADLGYGARGAGDQIPPNSALIFEVDLLDVQ